MKAQKSVFGKIVQVDGKFLFEDSAGKQFLIPEFNEEGTNLFKRVRQSFKRPDKYGFKVRVSGRLSDGKIDFTRVPAAKVEQNPEPVGNFTAPNGGLVALEYKPTVIQPATAEMTSDVLNFIHEKSEGLKPKMLFMKSLKWKYLVRNILRGKNIMMTGPAGCGKTMAAKALVKALDRPDFYFNLGATQDPRATLIGNTHFDKGKGTFFSESAFVTAIKTPNAVILLDELSRAHPDAWNILMTVLDGGQRYLRLDEAEGSPIVDVAEGVTFIATANIGNEYTSTRVMDRAILDRFVTIEMDVLDDVQELGLLKFMFPEVNEDDLKAVSEIAHHTRTQSMSENGKLTSMVSTRASVEMAGLLYDGFELGEAAEISIYPFFSQDGGVDSERTYIKQLVQKYQKDENGEPLFKDVDENTEEENEDNIPQF